MAKATLIYATTIGCRGKYGKVGDKSVFKNLGSHEEKKKTVCPGKKGVS